MMFKPISICLLHLISNSLVLALQSGSQIPTDSANDYLLLSDQDIVDNGPILSYLATASKEEVEEIVNSNPQIQEALLGKVNNVVRLKNPPSHNTSPHSDQNFHDAAPYLANNGLESGEEADYVDPDENDYGPLGTESPLVSDLKMRVTMKAARLIRIGSGLKNKLKALRERMRKLKHPKAKQNPSAQISDHNPALVNAEAGNLPGGHPPGHLHGHGLHPSHSPHRHHSLVGPIRRPKFHFNISTSSNSVQVHPNPNPPANRPQ